MIINGLLAALMMAAPATPLVPADQPRLCSTGIRGSAHLAYRPHGSPVFGSDGLTCATAKPGGEDVRSPAGRGKAREGKSKRKRAS